MSSSAWFDGPFIPSLVDGNQWDATEIPFSIIPAQAGVQVCLTDFRRTRLDACLGRRDDQRVLVRETLCEVLTGGPPSVETPVPISGPGHRGRVSRYTAV